MIKALHVVHRGGSQNQVTLKDMCMKSTTAVSIWIHKVIGRYAAVVASVLIYVTQSWPMQGGLFDASNQGRIASVSPFL